LTRQSGIAGFRNEHSRPPQDGNSNAAGHPGGRKKRRRQKGLITHLGKTALTPTVANSLILLADIKPGQVVIGETL